MIPELISPAELAKALKVSKQAVYAWVERGIIPHLRLEKCIRFDPEEIKEWLKEKKMVKKPKNGERAETPS